MGICNFRIKNLIYSTFVAVVVILTFLSFVKPNNVHCNSSACPLSAPPLSYSRKTLKCYSCINNTEGAEEPCSHEGKFVTCKYSQKLINWEDVSHTKSMTFACLLLIYRESANVKVKRGCVGLPTKDYSVCAKFKSKNIIKCMVCETDKCNASEANLGQRVSILCIILLFILIYNNL